MARELRALGYEVTTGVGGTGVVAVLRNGAGPTVMMRADMDGLPLEERSGLANPSRARQTDADGVEQPVMHACGHDVHITALVGTARQMMARRAQLVRHPDADRPAGRGDDLGRPGDGPGRALHPLPEARLCRGLPRLDADMPAGRISVPETIAYSSSDIVTIRVNGVGTHGASPHQGVDPVLVAAQIVVSLQSIVSRNINPLRRPGDHRRRDPWRRARQHHLRACRSGAHRPRRQSPEVRTQLLDGIDRVARGTALALGVPEDRLPVVTRSATETTPPTINHRETARRVRERDRRRDGRGPADRAAARRHGRRGFRLFRHARKAACAASISPSAAPRPSRSRPRPATIRRCSGSRPSRRSPPASRRWWSRAEELFRRR